MSMLQRIKRIVSANINHLVGKAEDPEMMIKELIREMDESIITLRTEVAKAIAAEKRIGRRIEDVQRKVQSWQENSEKAVRDGDDDLARKAIERKLDEENRLPALKNEHRKAVDVSRTMKEHLRKLEDKIQEARRKKEILIARKRSAEARRAMLSATENFAHMSRKSDILLTEVESLSPVSFESLEEEVTQLEVEAEAMHEIMDERPSLEQVFEESKKKEKIEAQLKEIKRRLKEE